MERRWEQQLQVVAAAAAAAAAAGHLPDVAHLLLEVPPPHVPDLHHLPIGTGEGAGALVGLRHEDRRVRREIAHLALFCFNCAFKLLLGLQLVTHLGGYLHGGAGGEGGGGRK